MNSISRRINDVRLMIAKAAFIIVFSVYLLYRRIFNPMSREEAIVFTYMLSIMLVEPEGVHLGSNPKDSDTNKP